ncbi:MAG: PilZ domain-containing protein [Sinobacteraceae bacterium]|nr:PilZ domain-containing protein [Nevskiaceae bacterium]
MIASASGLIGTGVVSQVSASGALIQSSLPLRPESLVRVRFKLPGRCNGSLRAELAGEVVRCTHKGFAVEWVEFAPDAIRALLEASRQAAARPALEAVSDQNG